MLPRVLFGWCAALAAGAATAQTHVVWSADFEAPGYALGNVTTSPTALGQGGWNGFNAVVSGGVLVRPTITAERAHGGAQSMHTTADTRVLGHLADPANPDGPGIFSLHPSRPWWLQAWVWIQPGGSARLTFFNGLGGCPLIEVSASGVPGVNTCLAQRAGEPSLGPQAHGQWLLLQMVHADTTRQDIEFSITGTGIDYRQVVSPYSGPGSGQPNQIGVRGDAFWDDIRLGTGPVPAPVPEPGAWALLLAGLGALQLAWGARLGGRRAQAGLSRPPGPPAGAGAPAARAG